MGCKHRYQLVMSGLCAGDYRCMHCEHEIDAEAYRYVSELTSQNAKLREALAGVLADIEGLMDESEGVYGLHLNGDSSPWEELQEGGQFERLTHISIARATLKEES